MTRLPFSCAVAERSARRRRAGMLDRTVERAASQPYNRMRKIMACGSKLGEIWTRTLDRAPNRNDDYAISPLDVIHVIPRRAHQHASHRRLRGVTLARTGAAPIILSVSASSSSNKLGALSRFARHQASISRIWRSAWDIVKTGLLTGVGSEGARGFPPLVRLCRSQPHGGWSRSPPPMLAVVAHRARRPRRRSRDRAPCPRGAGSPRRRVDDRFGLWREHPQSQANEAETTLQRRWRRTPPGSARCSSWCSY